MTPETDVGRRAYSGRLTTVAAAAVGVLGIHEIVQAARSHAFFWADDYAHLLLSKRAASQFGSSDVAHAMTTLLNGWGRPLMTLVYLPATMLDDSAVRVTSLAMLFAAAALCAAAARHQGLPIPLLAAVLLLSQPLTATLGFGALPATLFTMLLAAGFWLRARGNPVMAAIVISLLPLARLEGVIVIGLCAVFAVKGRQPRTLAALSVGLVSWVALSALFVQDPLWPIHSAYTTTLSSQYARQPLTFVFSAGYIAFGPVLAGLALASPFVKRFSDPLVPLSAAALVSFYGGVWAVGAFESLPNPVYLTSAAAPLALCAHVALAGLLERRTRHRVPRWLIVAGACIALAMAMSDGRRSLLVALVIIAIHQLSRQQARTEQIRRVVAGSVIVAVVLFGAMKTDARPFRGSTKLVAQFREQFDSRSDDVVASTDPTFSWEIDPKPLSADRQNTTGTLLVWNPVLAPSSGAGSEEDLVKLGFRQIWVASDGDDTLVVWERYEVH